MTQPFQIIKESVSSKMQQLTKEVLKENLIKEVYFLMVARSVMFQIDFDFWKHSCNDGVVPSFIGQNTLDLVALFRWGGTTKQWKLVQLSIKLCIVGWVMHLQANCIGFEVKVLQLLYKMESEAQRSTRSASPSNSQLHQKYFIYKGSISLSIYDGINI